MREQVVVTVFDTITITKTITSRESESGDTLRVSTVTERDHVRDRSQLRVKSEKLKVETDTVYVERDSLRLTAYSLINENENDNENKKTVLYCAVFSQSLSCVPLFATPWTVSPPGSSVLRILQARILEWVAYPFSNVFS